MQKSIRIQNKANDTVEISIEGVIGVGESVQFENPGERVATYEAFQKIVGDIKQLDAKRITVNIRSTGGDVSDALLIHDALVGLKAQIITRCYGYTASAATIIAQAASPGCREISVNALYLIHRAASSTDGNAAQMLQAADLLSATDDRIASIYAKRSNRSVRSFLLLMGENGGSGRWLSPNEAVDYGLADKIINPGNVRNSVKDAEILNYEMTQIINFLQTKKTKTMAEKKTAGPNLMARIGGFLTNAAKFLSPANFVYEDSEGNTLFSTASETDDLAVGMEVAFPDDTTGGTFELPDGRIVTIEDFVVTAIDDGSGSDELEAENKALKEQLAEAVALIDEMKGQIGSGYQPQNRTVTRVSTASRTVRQTAAVAKAKDDIKNEIKEKHERGFGRRGIYAAKK